MKKILPIIFMLIIIEMLVPGCFSAENTTSKSAQQQQMKKIFEQRLNLTEKQKEKARAIHKQGREQMTPIIYKIELNNQEITKIKANTKLSDKAKQEKITQIQEENKKLHKQATEIRRKNSEEFEGILNKNQKEELAKMKAEGRAKFEKNHPPRPPFAGLGNPNFLMPRPLFPYPHTPSEKN